MFFIFWSGWGIGIVIIYFFTLILTEQITNTLFNDPTYYSIHGLPRVIGGLIGTGLVWLFVKWLEKKPNKVFIDKQTGKEFTFKNKNRLFFIPVTYWPVILIVISILLYF